MTGDIVRRSETLDVLRTMEQAGAMSGTHLDLSGRPDLDLATFESIARFLGDLHDMSKWAIADLLLQAEARFGESAYQIATATGRSERTLANWCWVASRIPFSRRREALPFTQHAAVAALEPDEQKEWLDRAEAERWSSRELQAALRDRRELGEGERDECGDVVADAARYLRTRLRACGLDDTSILIEVSGAGFVDSVRIP